MRNVAIYRHQLFKRSEPFIEQQAMHLPTFHPIMVGRERWGDAPEGLANVAMSDVERYRGKIVRVRHALTRWEDPIAEMLRPFDVCLVHAHFGVEGVYAQRVATQLDVPLITTFHGFDVTTRLGAMLTSGKPSWANYVMHRRSLARRGDLFVCVSNYIRDRVVAQGFPAKRSVVHYIGVDTRRIAARFERTDRPFVLHVGRLVEKKGAGNLIEAFANLPKRHADVGLVIVGEGPLCKSLTHRVEALGIRERVTFLGARSQDEVLRLMGQAALLCQPSLTARSGDAEGLGMVLLEAAASGMPVVGTQSGGIPEAVVDGVTGLLANERDVNGLAACLIELLDSPQLREQMGRAARGHVEANFDVVRQSAALASLYQSLL